MTTLSPQELRSKGIKILTDELGAVDAARFLMQYDKGQGDYTRDRNEWLDDLTIDDIVKELNKNEKESDE